MQQRTQTFSSFIIYILFLILVFLSMWGCTPCNECNDTKLIKVNPAVSTLTTQLSVSTAVMHSNGTATSSISLANSGATINVSRADSVTTTMYISATDTTQGIKCITYKGGFGYTCLNVGGGGAIVLDGIIPETKNCFPMTTCCVKSHNVQITDLKQYVKCPSGRTFSNGGMQITGFVETCAGRIDTVSLIFNF